MEFPSVQVPPVGYRGSKVWFAATVVVVIAAVAAITYFLFQAGAVKLPTSTPSTPTASPTATVVTPAQATSSAKAVASDLKGIDLAALKNSISEIKSLLSAF